MTSIFILTYLFLLIILSKIFISKQPFISIFFIFFILGILIFFLAKLFKYDISLLIYSIITFQILICYLLTIGLKSMSSPSEYIFNILNANKKNYVSKDDLINDLKVKKIIDIRINDLIKQNIIIYNDEIYRLSLYGKLIFFFFNFLSKITKIKVRG